MYINEGTGEWIQSFTTVGTTILNGVREFFQVLSKMGRETEKVVQDFITIIMVNRPANYKNVNNN
jgi:hypothetical protein